MRVGHLSEIFTSFQGEGAHVGRRHLFVRTAGCNLRCRYCDTPDSLERTSSCTIYEEGREVVIANPISARQLHDILLARLAADAGIDAISLTGGEPLVQADYLEEVLSFGGITVPILLETNGMLPAQLRRLIDRIDIVSMDIKPPSNSGEAAFWEEHAEFLRTARRKQTYIKVMVDEQTSDEDMIRAGELVAQTAPDTEIYLQPLMSEDGQVLIKGKRLDQLFALIRSRIDAVRVVPQTHKLLRIQ